MDSVVKLFGVMMSVTLPVILIILTTEYFKYKKSTEAQLGRLRKEMDLNSAKELQEEVVLLRERVQVLERIVTDNSYEVERKIQSL